MPIKPPMIITKCCKSILGCETCCLNWYSGAEATMKRCPLCRAERGLSETMRLAGLDDFLDTLQYYFSNDNSQQQEDSTAEIAAGI